MLPSRLEVQSQRRRMREISGKVICALLAAHEVPLPVVMVERESQSLGEEAKTYVTRAGIEWTQYLVDQGKTEDGVRAEYYIEAERRGKSTLLLEQIAKRESREATPEDVETEVQGLMQQYRQPREAVLRMLQPNFNALLDSIVRTKAVDWLVQHAAVTDAAPVAAPEAPAAAALGLIRGQDEAGGEGASPWPVRSSPLRLKLRLPRPDRRSQRHLVWTWPPVSLTWRRSARPG